MAAIAGSAHRMGSLRYFRDRRRHGGRALCRPSLASSAPGGADRLFRTRAAAAALLSRHDSFGPADEGDAAGHRRAVVALARLLPRALLDRHVAGRAAAA